MFPFLDQLISIKVESRNFGLYKFKSDLNLYVTFLNHVLFLFRLLLLLWSQAQAALAC